ncbi:MAG: hypothetical protein QXG00_00115 [Candidatus Woesearchaeota archaeon]
MIKNKIKNSIKILLDPKTEFENLNKKTFESVVNDYVVLVFFLGILTGIFRFLISLIKVFYYNLVLKIDINFWRMINYELGRSVSTTFFYFFIGTFGIFFLSLILNLIFKKIKYIDLLKIIFYSISPLLLFSWMPFNPFFLIIWSIFLFMIGIKSYKNQKIMKNSIHQRY